MLKWEKAYFSSSLCENKPNSNVEIDLIGDYKKSIQRAINNYFTYDEQNDVWLPRN